MSAAPRFTPAVTTNDLRTIVAYLASDELEGRAAGSRGAEIAADYIAAQMKREDACVGVTGAAVLVGGGKRRGHGEGLGRRGGMVVGFGEFRLGGRVRAEGRLEVKRKGRAEILDFTGGNLAAIIFTYPRWLYIRNHHGYILIYPWQLHIRNRHE